MIGQILNSIAIIVSMYLNPIVTIITVVVCIAIIVDTYFYRKYDKTLDEYFKYLLKDFNDNKSSKSFENDALNKIMTEFIDSLHKVSNVNTQVIIEKYLYPENSKLEKCESKLDYMANLSTILGLLGTFIGLTCAIISIGHTLSSTSVESFLVELKPAISSMSGAFITSIAGLIASIIMNLWLSKCRITKQSLIDTIEDYLDNEEAKNKVNDTNSMLNMLQKMVDSIDAMNLNTQKSASQMENLVSDIKALNKEMKGFNSTMEKNSKNLVEATNGFNDVVDKFEKPLNSFTNSMDDFISSYNGMDDKIKELSGLVNESFKDIVDKFIKYFDENTHQQMNFIEKNNHVQKETIESMKNSADAINRNIKNLEGAYEEVSNITRYMEDNITKQNNKSMKVIVDLQNVLSKLNSEVSDMSDRIATNTAQTISSSTSQLNSGLLAELQSVTNKMERQLDEISREFNNTQVEQQRENRETLEIMKDTIQSIYKNVEQLQTISLVK